MGTVAETKSIPVGISNRHIHLTPEHVKILFGEGHELSPLKDLSQPGQYAAKETVEVVGPKGVIEGVRVLGPARNHTQIEVSQTDAFRLGVKPPVRDSGELENTPGVDVIGTVGRITLKNGVIIASRHIHMSPEDAQAFGLKDEEHVRVKVGGDRGLTFDNVLIRVSPDYVTEMHVDTDEANACLLRNGQEVLMLLK